MTDTFADRSIDGEPIPAYRADPARRQLLFGGAMLAAAGAAAALLPRRRAPLISQGALEAAIPTSVGPWTFRSEGDIVLPPQDELSQRIYDEIVSRVYYGPAGPPVMLLIAYGSGQSGMFQVHRPESCYPAQGYLLSDFRNVPVAVSPDKTVEGIFCTATGERIEQILYWTRIDQSFPINGNQEHLAVINSNLHGRLPDGLLVRMSVISPDADQSLALLERFADALAHSLGSSARRVMTGSPA